MEALSLPETSRCPGPLVAGLTRPRGRANLALQNAADERLTGLAAVGEEAAFEILYERYSAAILRYLRRRMRSAEEAEDVHQQVFLSAFSALRAGVEPLHFKAWLYRIAHNVCVSELRVQRPVTAPIDDERGLACLRADAGRRGREDLRELLDDLALLPRAQSTALLLREVHDLSYAEIGETLHVPVGAVRSNIFRARASLHALAAARDVDCSEIRSELERLAGRRGRRSAHIANHLRVCQNCQDYRRGLRHRPLALSLLPLLPLSWQRTLRGLFGSPASESTTGELCLLYTSPSPRD